MDLTAFEDLLSLRGQEVLAYAGAHYSDAGALALGARLRREHPADLVAAALTQAGLRARGRSKFGTDADRMYFTPAGLEQATRGRVAAHRAERFAAAGVETVADLCCGIGGDLLALARRGLQVDGTDADGLTVAVARANVEALGLRARARVTQGDATAVDRTSSDAVFADPARRSERGRSFDLDAYAPPWSFVTSLFAGTACVKVAPGIPHNRIPDAVEAEWVSDRGELKEAALWSGTLRTQARRRATVLPAGATLTDADDPGPGPVTAPAAYLYEPDDAVVRAGLVTAVAALVGGALLDPRIAYVTGERLVPTPFATAYRVRADLPYDLRTVRAALRAHDVGVLTVKKRGVDVDPAVVRRKLKPSGSRPATLVLARIDTGARALLVDPV